MSKIVPLKGGTTGRLLLPVGSRDEGEVFWDEDEKRAYANDTAEAGGVPIWHSDLLSETNDTIIEGVNDSTPVNYLRVANGDTGVPPAISAQGSDTNISLSLTAKGTGDILLTAPSTGDVFLGRAGARIPITKASSNPGWTDAGGLFNDNGGEWYSYDSTRSKFLGLAPYVIAFGRNAATISASDPFWTYGGWDPDAPSGTKGIRIPWDSTIVAYTWNSSSVAASPTIAVRDHTSNLFTFSPGTVSGTAASQNTDVDEGEFLNVMVTANSIAHPQVTLFLKRRF